MDATQIAAIFQRHVAEAAERRKQALAQDLPQAAEIDGFTILALERCRDEVLATLEP